MIRLSLHDPVVFKCLPGQRINVSFIYLSHIDGFRDVVPHAISSKYSVYMLANVGDNGHLKASLCQYMLDLILK